MRRGGPRDGDLQESNYRIPPNAIEVEKHILGGIFVDGLSFDDVSPILESADFYLEKNQIIYSAILQLAANKTQIDIITISEQLKKNRQFDHVNDSYLMEISAEVVSSANIAQHARIVKEKSISRRVIQTATRILERAYGGEMEGSDLIEYSEDEVYQIGDSMRGMREGLVDMPTAVLRMAKQVDDTADGKINRTRLGIPAIDDVMNGLRNGALNVLAARPGFGKSALALQAAVQCGKPVPFFSLEMLIEEEVERLMAQLDPSLNADGIATQALVIAKRGMIEQALTKISKYPIEICDSSRVTVPFVQSECRRMKRKYGELGMIIVDYLQMLEAVGNHKRRDLEVGSVSTGLKKVGNDLRTPVLAVASLSRKPEERDNKRPIESDLRDAGQIESDAHGIIFLYRHAKYNAAAKADKLISNIVEVIIPKNRGGPTGRTLLNFNGAQSWFFGLTEQDQRYYSNFLKGLDFNGDDKPDNPASGGKGGGKSGRGKKGHHGPPSADWGADPSLLPPAEDR
jgi:replicative DNA helicase